MAAAVAGITSNGTWLAGGGYLGYWKQDKLKYSGFAGYGHINLDYYGLGGQNKRNCNENSFDRDRFEHFCYDEKYGAMLIEANTTEMVVKFITVDNKIVDTIVLQQSISS